FVFSACVFPPDLHSFPTRRSSDLERPVAFKRPIPFEPAGHPPIHVAAECFLEPLTSSRRGQRSLKTPGDSGEPEQVAKAVGQQADRKSTRLNSSHQIISYAVFCLK